jgi:sarcosine oxidase
MHRYPGPELHRRRAPECPLALVVSACSGHGFKHSAAFGKTVAQLLTEVTSNIDLAPFGLDHFRMAGSGAR